TIRGVVAGQNHVRLQERAAEIEPLIVQLRVDRLENTAGCLPALRDRVRAVLQYLRLDDRNDVGFLAERCVPGERVRVRPDAVLARLAGGDRVGSAPLREAGAEPAVLVEPLSQPVEAFGDGLAIRQRQRLRARV